MHSCILSRPAKPPGVPAGSNNKTRTVNATAASKPTPAVALDHTQQQHPYTAKDNYTNLRSSTGSINNRPVSGYAGKWSRYQGPSLTQLLANGDIIYGFRAKPDAPNVCQVWKAEEGDLDSPKLQKQRKQLPQLQKDALQLQLEMDTLIVEVSEELPLLQPSMSDDMRKRHSAAEPHPAGLSSCMRVLAAPEWGNLVVTGGLPPVGKEGMPGEPKTWFNRIYMRVPGPDGGRRWSVLLSYDNTSGALLTHYHTWEAAVCPAPDTLQQVFTPGAHKRVVQQMQERSCGALGSISEFIARHGSRLSCTRTTISYDDGLEASISSDNSCGSFEQAAGDQGTTVEVWYDSGCYFRAPSSLADVVAGEDVVLEAGAVFRDAAAGNDAAGSEAPMVLTRWLLCYSSRGDRRLKWARHEVQRPA